MSNHRHGGPFDRGRADSWYRRGRNPHYYVGGSYSSERVDKGNMTAGEIKEYNAGYDDNEASGCFKDWG
jgi:hypothetical protein